MQLNSCDDQLWSHKREPNYLNWSNKLCRKGKLWVKKHKCPCSAANSRSFIWNKSTDLHTESCYIYRNNNKGDTDAQMEHALLNGTWGSCAIKSKPFPSICSLKFAGWGVFHHCRPRTRHYTRLLSLHPVSIHPLHLLLKIFGLSHLVQTP